MRVTDYDIERRKKVVTREVASFVADGYVIQSQFLANLYLFFRLHHHSNSHLIIIHAYLDSNRWVIKKDGTIVKQQNII